MNLDNDSDKNEENPGLASSKYPIRFILLDLKPQSYALPIIVYNRQDLI